MPYVKSQLCTDPKPEVFHSMKAEFVAPVWENASFLEKGEWGGGVADWVGQR